MTLFRNSIPLMQVIDDDKLDIAVVQSINTAQKQVSNVVDVDVELRIEGDRLDSAKLVIEVNEK